MPVIECRNLVKEFSAGSGSRLGGGTRRLRAVDSVSIAIAEGETLGLVGESGCGKTTLGRCLVGLTQPSSGEVLFEGIRVDELTGNALRSLCRKRQIVFQDPFASLDPRWRIGAMLEEPLRVHNIVPATERSAELAKLLTDVGLSPEIVNHFPHEFSGGQRQRIGIARALSVRPRFLIADEPVSALDVSVRAQILNLLVRLQSERNLAQLFITHDLGAVKHVSRRVAVMYLGSIVEEAPTDELFDNPRHPYTRTLLDAVPRAGGARTHAAIGSADEPATSVAAEPHGCKFRNRCAYAQPLCSDEVPPLASIGVEGHRAACHFARELPAYTAGR
ncbi:MAG TPA: ABC transporter ATP-binding protein [Capsulimonadaceae bacterium]|jgi:oligopeptide/dipeptide ABC transporter ATP-binding protein